MVIAIDGPAGVGKSTIARHLATSFGCLVLNTGRFYRALTYRALSAGLLPTELGLPEVLVPFSASLHWEFLDGAVVVDGVPLGSELHSVEVDVWVAQVSEVPEVRSQFNAIFRSLGKKHRLVCEGRDITSVVFPEADVRLFLDATPEVRARRRFEERPEDVAYERVLDAIRERDSIDRNKKHGPLVVMPGVHFLDCSDLTIAAVCARVADIVLASSPQSRSFLQAMAETDNNQTILQEEYLKNLENLQEGSLVEGTVISVSSDSVSIGIGYKSDGVIPLTEFQTPPQVGDRVKVVLERKESSKGSIEISKEKADAISFREQLNDAYEKKTPLTGKFTKVVKGGYEVDLGHTYRAFVPLSKADSVRVEVPEELLGKVGSFLVEKLVWEKTANIVLNRRDLLLRETDVKRSEFFQKTKEGDVVEGEVKSFTSFGAFVDLGGFDGLLHLNDMSWGHVTRPKDFVQKGDKIKLKVVKLDPTEKKINLSLKALGVNPWVLFEKKFKVGDVVTGKVTKLADFGAFIEIEEGVEGLVHISEMSWVKRISHPKEVLKPGDIVQTKILAYDMEQTRISLGLKQVSANPWDEAAVKFPVGKVLTLPVKKVTPVGAFVTLEEGVDGFLHVDDLSWVKKSKNATSELKDGQMVEVKVLSVDTEARRIRLGVKQVGDDPWESLRKSYPRGTPIEGSIVSKTEFGVFLRVLGNIEGLIPKSNLCDTRDQTADDFMKSLTVGDKLKVLVMEVSVERQKLSLSLKDFVKQQQKEEISKYIQKDDDHSSFRLGDLFKK
ncbi:MAG: (d)CMP kinase [Spirochaetales bacterium]